MCLIARKPVWTVYDQVIVKLDWSATEIDDISPTSS